MDATMSELPVLEISNASILWGCPSDNRHRTRALVAGDGREIGIQANQALFSMVGRIQEERSRWPASPVPS